MAEVEVEVEVEEAARETIVIGNETFYSDSLTEDAKIALENIEVITAAMRDKETEFSIYQIARNATVKELSAMFEQFEKVEDK